MHARSISMLPFANPNALGWERAFDGPSKRAALDDGSLELYDPGSDLGETTNLATREPTNAQRLVQSLRAWRAEAKANMPLKP